MCASLDDLLRRARADQWVLMPGGERKPLEDALRWLREQLRPEQPGDSESSHAGAATMFGRLLTDEVARLLRHISDPCAAAQAAWCARWSGLSRRAVHPARAPHALDCMRKCDACEGMPAAAPPVLL